MADATHKPQEKPREKKLKKKVAPGQKKKKRRPMTHREFHDWLTKERARRAQAGKKAAKEAKDQGGQDLWDKNRPFSGGGGPGTGKRR